MYMVLQMYLIMYSCGVAFVFGYVWLSRVSVCDKFGQFKEGCMVLVDRSQRECCLLKGL